MCIRDSAPSLEGAVAFTAPTQAASVDLPEVPGMVEPQLDREARVLQEVPQHLARERGTVPSTLALEPHVRKGRVVAIPATQGLQDARFDDLMHAGSEPEERLVRRASQLAVAVPPTHAVGLALGHLVA
eukprot:6177211-Alexandrium_andersonii.AAC.1